MLLKKLLVITSCMAFITASASAAPLTNFDTYNGSLDLGVWNTDAKVGGEDFSGLNRFNGGLTVGIGGPWGLQYRYFDMKTKSNTHSTAVPGELYSDHYKGSTNEFNVLYSLGKNSRVALFAGVNRVSNKLINSSFTPGLNSIQEDSRSVFQGGLVATMPLGHRVDAYLLGGIGSHGLSQGEVGLSAKVSDSWQANLGYRRFKVDNAFDDNSRSHVKVDGITFGVTYLFGKKSVAVVPIEQPPAVVETPVIIEQPVAIVQPPVQKIVLQSVLFDYDKDTLQPQAYAILAQVIDVANKNPNWTYLLVGHTDSDGTKAYNMDLSMRRVKTVQNYLISQGIPSRLLSIDEKGENQPIDTNTTDEGRTQNRRVEIHIN
jgi:OOP family OmpA-OmpF porin